MSVEFIRDLFAIAASVIAIGTAIGIWRRLGPVVREMRDSVSAIRELTDAQLARNGGSSLTDKVTHMHAAMFPIEELSLPETVIEIRAEQVRRANETLERIGKLEQQNERWQRNHEENQGALKNIGERLERIEARISDGGL